MLDDETWWHIANSILQQVGLNPSEFQAALEAHKQAGLPPDHAVDKVMEESGA